MLAAALPLRLLPSGASGQVGAKFKAKASGASYVWSPSHDTAHKGQKIVWKNPTSVTHTLKFYKGPWKGLSLKTIHAGDSFKKKAKKKGTYLFYCTLHGFVSNGTCSG